MEEVCQKHVFSLALVHHSSRHLVILFTYILLRWAERGLYIVIYDKTVYQFTIQILMINDMYL